MTVIVISSIVYGGQVYTDQDTYVQLSTPNTNRDGLQPMWTQARSDTARYRTFLHFNITDSDTVDSAILHWYFGGGGNQIVDLNLTITLCCDDFDETTLTWNNQAAEVENCGGSPFYESPTTNYAVGYYTLNVTPQVNACEDEITFKYVMYPEDYDATSRYLGMMDRESGDADSTAYINFTYPFVPGDDDNETGITCLECLNTSIDCSLNYTMNSTGFRLCKLEDTKMILAALILAPMLLGFMFLLGSFFLGKEHSVLKIALFILTPITFWVSLNFGTIALVEIYNMPDLIDSIGRTTYYTGTIFFILLIYFLIYGFYKMTHIAAQKRKERLEY